MHKVIIVSISGLERTCCLDAVRLGRKLRGDSFTWDESIKKKVVMLGENKVVTCTWKSTDA